MKKKEKLVALLKGLAARIPRRMMQVRMRWAAHINSLLRTWLAIVCVWVP